MFCRKCGEQIPDDSTFCYKCGIEVNTVSNDSSTFSTIDKVPEATKAAPTQRMGWKMGIMAIIAVLIVMILLIFGDSSPMENVDTPDALIKHLTSFANSKSVLSPVAGGPINEKWLDKYPVTQYTIGDQITLEICEYPDTGEIALIAIGGDGKLFDGDDAYTMGFYAATLVRYYTSSSTESEQAIAELHMDNQNLFTPVDATYQSDKAIFQYNVDNGIVALYVDFRK